jgi:serine protease Do
MEVSDKMRISKLFLTTIVFCVGVSAAFAQQTPKTPTTPKTPKTPEPFVFAFGDEGSYLGIYAEDVTRENASKFNLKEPRGVAIEKVIEDSPAAKAGLQNGDVILRFNGEEVTSVRKLNRLIDEVAPDHKVKLTISRNGDEKDIIVTLGKRSEMTAKAYEPLLRQGQLGKLESELGKLKELGKDKMIWSFGSFRRIGVSTMELNKQLADYFGVAGGKGVLITEVKENSPAAKAGLKAGDVITAVDGEAIERTGELSRAISQKKEGEEVTLTVIRDKSQQSIKVTPELMKGELDFPGFELNLPDRIGGIIAPRVQVTPQIKITPPTINVAPRIRVKPFKRAL